MHTSNIFLCIYSYLFNKHRFTQSIYWQPELTLTAKAVGTVWQKAVGHPLQGGGSKETPCSSRKMLRCHRQGWCHKLWRGLLSSRSVKASVLILVHFMQISLIAFCRWVYPRNAAKNTSRDRKRKEGWAVEGAFFWELLWPEVRPSAVCFIPLVACADVPAPVLWVCCPPIHIALHQSWNLNKV